MRCYSIFICFDLVSNQDKCCKEISMNWEHQEILHHGQPISSPLGVFTKLAALSEYNPVYYNEVTKYYLYKRPEEWVVSIS